MYVFFMEIQNCLVPKYSFALCATERRLRLEFRMCSFMQLQFSFISEDGGIMAALGTLGFLFVFLFLVLCFSFSFSSD